MNRKEKVDLEFKSLPKEQQTAKWWESYHEETRRIEDGAKELIKASLTPEMKVSLYDQEAKVTYWCNSNTGEVTYMIESWGCGCCAGDLDKDSSLEDLLGRIKKVD